MIFQTWRIATENRTRKRGKKMNDVGCLEVRCNIKSLTTLSLGEVFRSACHGLALTEDFRYVLDDPTMKNEIHG